MSGRSGYPETLWHQAIKAAVDKWNKMWKTEDEGGCPIHRPREWQGAARRLERESRLASWHQTHKGQISAPLILDLLGTSQQN